MNHFRLASPWWLLALIPIVFLLIFQYRRESSRSVLLYSSVGLVQELPKTVPLRVKRLLPWLPILGLAFMVFALARPQHGLEEFRIRAEGIAIQMCLDRSGSMQAMDFRWKGRHVNRLEAVKQVFRDFVMGKGELRGRTDDQIGLVVFGGFAEARSPLTLDHGALLQVLDGVEIPQPITDSRGRVLNERILEEERATAIGDAIALAVDRLAQARAKSRIIILLSDGENTAGAVTPAQAAELAAQAGIKVYTIGVGSTGRAPFPARDAFGRDVLVPQLVRLDETTLRMLADVTGGKYYNAQSTDALHEVYRDIDQLEKTATEGRLYTEYRELFQGFVLPGLGLILLEIGLRCTRFRSLP
jgi:Ca-activated chloride channel family protein